MSRGTSTFRATTAEAKATERTTSMEAWRENTAHVTTANARMDMVSLEKVVVVVAMVIDFYFMHSGFLKLRTI